ncbi:MAG TPA: hypothetical protein VF402_06310, partial [Asticcacaulis sp.]
RYNGPDANWAEPDLRAARESLGRLIATEDLRRRLGGRARQDMIALNESWQDQAAWLPPASESLAF